MPTVYQYTTENLAIGDVYGGHDPNRYYLHEYFEKVPSGNGDIDDATHVGDTTPFTDLNKANKSFEFIATGASSTCSFNQNGTGINLVTDSNSAGDNVIVLPHLDTGLSAWENIYWKTSSQVHWSCALKINNVSDVIFWAGLKLTNTKTLATDANQAYFTFDPTNRSGGEAFTNTGNLHFVYSIGDTDYVTDLGIAVAADTIYKLRIEIDSNRQVQVYVNDTLYGLSTTESSSGNTALNALVKSLALTDGINLKPYIGVETNTNAAKTLNLCYQHISKVIS